MPDGTAGTVELKAQARRTFVVTIVVTFLVVQGIGIIAPVLPTLAERWGLSGLASALLLTSVALGRLLFSLPGGALADRFGFRSVAVFASLGVASCALVAALTQSYWVLVAAQFGEGMGSAAFTTAAMSAIVKDTSQTEVARALARFQGAILLGFSVSPLLGGFAVDVIGVAGPFWVYAVSAAGAAVLSAVALPTTPASAGNRRREPQRVRYGALVSYRPLLLAAIVSFATLWSVGGIRNTLVPLFAAAQYGFSGTAIGAVLAVAALANVAALGPAGRLADKAGRRPAVRVGMASVTVATLALAVATDAWIFVVVVALSGAAKGLVSVAPLAVVADVVDEGSRGRAVGISRSAGELGLVLGPVMVGAASDLVGTRMAFLLSAGLLALVTAVTAPIPETLSRGRGRRSPSPESASAS